MKALNTINLVMLDQYSKSQINIRAYKSRPTLDCASMAQNWTIIQSEEENVFLETKKRKGQKIRRRRSTLTSAAA